jgi:hypothetical protein
MMRDHRCGKWHAVHGGSLWKPPLDVLLKPSEPRRGNALQIEEAAHRVSTDHHTSSATLPGQHCGVMCQLAMVAQTRSTAPPLPITSLKSATSRTPRLSDIIIVVRQASEGRFKGQIPNSGRRSRLRARWVPNTEGWPRASPTAAKQPAPSHSAVSTRLCRWFA